MASEGASWGEEGLGSAEGAQVQHSDQQVDNIAQESHVSGDVADDGTEEDGGDYDPESVTTWSPAPVPEQDPSATSRQASKPKMSGGFIVEASDDEDEGSANDAPDAAPTTTYNQLEPSTTSTEVNTPVDPVAHVVPVATAASAPVPATTTSPIAPTPVDSSSVTPAVTSLISLDPVALLEARVKEDPRGDMDAWLSLIADHRQSNRLDQARKTYNAFLEVFPQAVSETRPARIRV